jgi:hypothetical protein
LQRVQRAATQGMEVSLTPIAQVSDQKPKVWLAYCEIQHDGTNIYGVFAEAEAAKRHVEHKEGVARLSKWRYVAEFDSWVCELGSYGFISVEHTEVQS